jgi:hypothetical protein
MASQKRNVLFSQPIGGFQYDHPLRFHVAPHILQDLGLNPYPTLPRVLVELVSNAYDADSASVRITFDTEKIQQATER